MRTLYLLRHGKSSWDSPNLSDFERPLDKRGLKETVEIAEFIKEKGYIPEKIICSSAKRTRQTVKPILETLEFEGSVEYLDSLYLANSEEIKRIVDGFKSESILVVGHNPGLEVYLSNLVGRELYMKTSHLAVIDMEKMELIEFIRPKDFI